MNPGGTGDRPPVALISRTAVYSSILIVRLSALGDVVHVLPSLAAIRDAFPKAKIGWAIEDKAAKLLQGHPQIDRLHVIPRKELTRAAKSGRGLTALGGARRVLTELRGEGYEVALDFQSNFRSAFLTRLSGAPLRVGQPSPHAKEGSHLFYSRVPPGMPFERHKIVRNLNLLRAIGLDPEPQRVALPVAEHPDIEAALPKRRGRPWVALHAGVSAFGAIKAWRPERFAELARGLVLAGADVFFCWGGDSERKQAQALTESAPGTFMAPETALSQLAWFLEQVDLFVGVDSGPLHVAAAMGTPVLGLYGPKHVSTYGPFWSNGVTIAADYPCSPCRHRRCPLPEAKETIAPDGSRVRISPCMDTIRSENALEIARSMLPAMGV